MASKTETALAALKTALDTIAGADAAKPLPLVSRNEDLISRLADLPSGLSRFANLWDGEQIQRNETSGADVIADGYEIQHEAHLELAFVADDATALQDAHDAAVLAVCNLLRADPTLGGAVDYAAIGDLKGPGSGLATDGISHSKGMLMPVVLTFVSSVPF